MDTSKWSRVVTEWGERGRASGPGLRGFARWPLYFTVPGALIVAIGVVWGSYAVFAQVTGLEPAQHLTAAFATATAAGAVVALVLNVRKQDLAEQSAVRDIAAAFTERFRAAASQLGGASPAERLAGVYAMAALGDEYPLGRQQCVDVLCAYLRLPFSPERDEVGARTIQTVQEYVTTTETSSTRSFDLQVRQSIITVIREHTKITARTSWSGLEFDFTGAHLVDADFAGANFSGERTSFDRATFSGDSTSFDRATFSAASTSFKEADFIGVWTSFDNAIFSGKRTSFDNAIFSAVTVTFNNVVPTGASSSLSGLEQPNLQDGATVSANGRPFTGWGEHPVTARRS